MMIIKSEHTVEEVLAAIEEAQKPYYNSRPFYFHGDRIGLRNNRMLNFKINGTTCKECGMTGVIFRKEKHAKGHNSDEVKYWHLNLYGLDRKNSLVLMTRDHIIPSSKGGTGSIQNSQTLCRRCNGRKSNYMPGEPIPPPPIKIGRLDWSTWKRRLKYCVINSWKTKSLVLPSRANSRHPTIKSFWRF